MQLGLKGSEVCVWMGGGSVVVDRPGWGEGGGEC